MKHKFDSYSITDIVGVLDKNENNELCIFVELKDNIKEVPIVDLLDTMVWKHSSNKDNTRKGIV